MSDEFAFLDATALADLVRRGQVHPRELVEAAIARIERLDPEINAVITPHMAAPGPVRAKRTGTAPTRSPSLDICLLTV
jgi:amidase